MLGLAPTVGEKFLESSVQDWLREHVHLPQWVSWAVMAGFGVVTVLFVGYSLFAPHNREARRQAREYVE